MSGGGSGGGAGDEREPPAARAPAAAPAQGEARTARPRARGAASALKRAVRAATVGLPGPDFDVPLHELERDALSVFLYVALMPEETVKLVRELGLSQPGFRQGSLGPVQRCDLLADELRARPEAVPLVLKVLREGWERPVLHRWPLEPEAARDLLEASSGEGALALALWRALCDPSPAVRAEANPLLAQLVAELYGPGEGRGPAEPAPDQEGDALAAAQRAAEVLRHDLQAAETRLQQVEARAESARRKGEEAREKLQSWLKEARAREARAVDEAARAREAAEGAQRERSRLADELAALRAHDAATELPRLRGQLKEAEARAAALLARAERAEEQVRALEGELERARTLPGPVEELPAVERAPVAQGDADEAATWLMPIYSREFYASLEGWDRRIQRAAFKQAHLLAQDHRHPSLRALPLEGLPGYYRVRVATDVRLLYRRASERQNTVEILSLIDREDLDRYVRQAKTR